MYGKLVKSEDDLVGLVAYGIYKKHKIEFIKNVKNTKARTPTNDEFETFYASCSTLSQIEQYRSAAEELLSNLVLDAAGEEIEKTERSMLADYQTHIKAVLPSWKTSVFHSVLGAFVFSALLAIVFLLGATSEQGLMKYAKAVAEQVTRSQDDRNAAAYQTMEYVDSTQHHNTEAKR